MKNARSLRFRPLLLLIGVAVFAISGCSNDDSPSNIDDASTIQLKPVKSSQIFEDDLKNYYSELIKNQQTPASSEQIESQRQDSNTNTDSPTFATANAESSDAAISTSNVSGTNLVEAGINEADLVKSDGRHLFIGYQSTFESLAYTLDAALPNDSAMEIMPIDGWINSRELIKAAGIRILAMDNETPETSELTHITFPDDVSRITGLYLTKYTEEGIANQLIAITQTQADTNNNHFFPQQNTLVIAYDISSPSEPVKQWDFKVEGNYTASRNIKDKLYLIASKSLWRKAFGIYNNPEASATKTALINKITIDDILPATWVNGEIADIIDTSNCMMPEQTRKESVFSASLLAVYTIPTDNPEETQSFCTLEASQEVYVSPKAIYFTKGEYVRTGNSAGKNYTTIHKLTITDDNVSYQSSIRIPGWTGWRSQAFRMSEKDGDLRIIVTQNERTQIPQEQEPTGQAIEPFFENSTIAASGDDETSQPVTVEIIAPRVNRFHPVHRLYVLREDDENNGQLTILSQLPNVEQPSPIGKPREDIYSVRYFGDYAYVVTFRRTDPLYAINLSSPSAPYIEGELSIPGYSDYLHPISNDLLLGIGKDASENGNIQGLKAALFDVSDKSNPSTLKEILIGNRGSDTPLSRNHHAFSILSDNETGNHKISFPVTVYDTEITKTYGNRSFTQYQWTYSGLQLLEVDDGTISATPMMTNAGAIKAFKATKENQYHYVKKARSVIVDDAVHYIEGTGVWSSLWDQPSISTYTE